MRAVLVPGVLALLPRYAGLTDPVAELRSACERAVAWLGSDVTVLADAQGRQVADHLLSAAGVSTSSTDEPSYLVVGNGSAKRRDTSPGYLDDRAAGFDAALRDGLVEGTLPEIDADLARELWASTDAIAELTKVLPPGARATVDYDDDPLGVQYWVMRWEW